MAIDKLIPQYLNSDTDQKLVKSVEMTDNLNVRVSNNAEGTAGVIKNIKGTEALSGKTPADTLPAGDNRVVGSVANDKNKEILFFLWNSNDNHGIYRLDVQTDSFEKVYEDSVLNFQKLSFVDCDVVVNEEEETLLYWTDNINPPMKLNVNRALNNGYPSTLTSGTDAQKLEALTVAKKPPQEPITFEFITDDSVNQNNLKDDLFQFAYQYVYKDGEVSAISSYSKIAYSSSQTLIGISPEGNSISDNAIRLTIPSGNDNVDKIKILARRGNQGQLFQIEEIDNTASITYDFYNNGAYPFVSTNEANKMFDNVPQKAKSVICANNRIFYGNYVEGYNNVDTDVSLYPVYKRVPETYNITSDINPLTTGNEVETRYQTTKLNLDDDVSFRINFSDVPDVVKEGTLFSFDIQFGVTQYLEYYREGTSITDTLLTGSFEWDDDGTANPQVAGLGSVLTRIRIAANPFTISFSKIYNQNTSKSTVINEVLAEINNEIYSTTVSPDLDNSNHATASNNSFLLWLAGKAGFKAQNGSYDSASDNLTFDINFQGADLFIAKATRNGDEKNILSGGNFDIPSYDYSAANQPSNVVLQYYQYKNFFTSSSISEDINLSSSFKTKANHEFGIVYYDDRNRSGGVNKLPVGYVAGYGDFQRTGNLGAVEFDFRLKHTAPSWAAKWQLVYTKNTTYDDFLQYSVSEAFIAQNTDSSTTISGNEGNRIYVSARSLEGKENSYKDGKGARLEYKFEEGDKLRILKYEDGFTKRPVNLEFRIIGYEYLNDDDTNPLVLSTQRGFRQTGWFFVLSNEEYDGFSYSDVLADNDLWGQNCLVEVYKPKKQLEEYVYYEVGECYDVINGVHGGARDTSSAPTASITVSYAGTVSGYAESTDRFYIGDVLNLGTHTIEILSIRYQSNGRIGYEFRITNPDPTTLTPASYSCTIVNYTEAVITSTEGDVYFRPRNVRLNPYDSTNSEYDETSTDSTVYQLEYIEDYSLNDFFSSKSVSIGRPQAYSSEFKQIRRKASITYSDAYVIDSERLNLSSFNLSLGNWTDLSLEYGQIDRLISRGDAITVLQESKASQLPVGRNIIEYANGDAGVTVSKNVLGLPSYYAGNFGTSGNPESVINRFGVVYFTDLNSRKVIRLSADGITPISDKGMDSFFQKLLEDLDKNVSTPKIVGGFDPDNDEYLITVEDFSDSTITVQNSDPQLDPTSYTVEIDEDGNYSPTPTYTSTQVIWNTLNFNWNHICQDWEEVGNGYLEVDGVFYIDSQLQGNTGTISILITDSTNSWVGVAQYNLGTGVVTIPAQTCDQRNITTAFGGAESDGVTIAYKHKQGVWGAKYSFQPSNYINVGNALYSFFDNDNGLVWRHNVNDTRNLLYGVQYHSMFEVVSNRNPSMIKTYHAMGIEGGGTWTGVIKNQKQETNVDEFFDKEGHQYAMISRDTINSTSHQIFLGTVESVNGNKVTFSTPVNRLPFVIGDNLKVANGSSLDTTGVSIVSLLDRKTIQCSGIAISVGDQVFVEHSAVVDGDPIRDVYASIKLTCSDTEPFEVHAVSAHFDRSKLHNDRVN